MSCFSELCEICQNGINDDQCPNKPIAKCVIRNPRTTQNILGSFFDDSKSLLRFAVHYSGYILLTIHTGSSISIS